MSDKPVDMGWHAVAPANHAAPVMTSIAGAERCFAASAALLILAESHDDQTAPSWVRQHALAFLEEMTTRARRANSGH